MNIGLIGNLSRGKTVTCCYLADNLINDYKRDFGISKRLIANTDISLKNHSCYRLSNKDLLLLLKEPERNKDRIERIFKNSVYVIDEISNLLFARKSTIVNELVLNLCMMFGKLDCDLIYTAQRMTTQVDVLLRDLTDIKIVPTRVTMEGAPIVFGPRFLTEKIMIKCSCKMFIDDKVKKFSFFYDPEPYYDSYESKRIELFNRNAFAKGGEFDLSR